MNINVKKQPASFLLIPDFIINPQQHTISHDNGRSINEQNQHNNNNNNNNNNNSSSNEEEMIASLANRTVRSFDVVAPKGQCVFKIYLLRASESTYENNHYEIQAHVIAFRHWHTGRFHNTPSKQGPSPFYDNQQQGTRRVGSLHGHLLRRPCSDFFESAKLTSELKELSLMFCDSYGIGGGYSCCIQHPMLCDEAINGGGFLHIQCVEIKPEYRGRDLGAQLVHSVLTKLRGNWTLAVMMPLQLVSGEWISESHDCDARSSRHINTKIQRQFARLGFIQAGNNSKDAKVWFHTSSMFFHKQGQSRRMLSKTEAQEIDIFTPKEPHEPTGMHRELHALIHYYGRSHSPFNLTHDILHQMTWLVNKGASVHQAGAIHVAVSYGCDRHFLCALINLGGDLNAPDEYGTRPLHVTAAGLKHPITVEALLSLGADPDVRDEMDETPIEKAMDELVKCKRSDDCMEGLDAPPNLDLTALRFRLFSAFVTKEERETLRDRWMSPVLAKVLSTILDLILSIIDNSLKESFEDLEALSLARYPEIICILKYVSPVIITQYFENFPKTFIQGMKEVFCAISHILNDLEGVPRTDAVHKVLEEQGYQFVSKYLDLGGKVDHALDALIGISKNVFLTGIDVSGLVYDDIIDEIICMSSSPLDGMFDVAWIQCISCGGGTINKRGPFPIETSP